MIDLVRNLAAINRRIKGSVIRELLKISSLPGVISFAGGLPDPAAFPVEILKKITDKVLTEKPQSALQYGTTEGSTELKEQIVKMFKEEENITLKPENILVTTSSQQALDIVGKAFIDPDDPIIMELPTYIGGLQAFLAYGAKAVGIECDNDGILIGKLEHELQKLKKEEEHYKFVYLVPDFQNPSGVTMSEERRKKVIELSKKYSIFIIEDTPYRQTRFEGKTPTMMQAMNHEGNVISLFTFSKILAPGLRLGYIVANEEIIKKMAKLKQSMDLCSPPISQAITAQFLKEGHLSEHIKKITKLYKSKRDIMVSCLEKYMPKGVTWTNPQGGLFLFLKLPKNLNADELFHKALEKKVAYIVGSAFHCDGSGTNTIRLNFSFPTPENIDEGIKRLAEVVRQSIASKQKVA
jgi:2-aminoadipate transaminase